MCIRDRDGVRVAVLWDIQRVVTEAIGHRMSCACIYPLHEQHSPVDITKTTKEIGTLRRAYQCEDSSLLNASGIDILAGHLSVIRMFHKGQS